MKLEPECIGCLLDQMFRAFKLIRPNISNEIIISTQKKLMKYLIEIDINKTRTPIIGKVAYNLVAETLGVQDPYYNLKKQYNHSALKVYDDVKNFIDKAQDPLFEAILVAALGNTIDFATPHKIDFISDLKQFTSENMKINDYLEFKKSLANTNHLLIIGDNAGEIVFDKLLIVTIKKFYPNLEIIYSVRSYPIINDATMEDARQVGLTDLVTVIESCSAPGIDLSMITDNFNKHFNLKKGVVLSKGQGNFESLYQIELPNKELYYLLKAKCNLMKRIFNVEIGDLIFKKKTEGF
jgi:uncharacterized protein with ATP-grasp and redox domains